MARIIIKESRVIVESGKRRVISKRATYYAPDEEHDFHTEYGAIPKESLEKGGLVSVGKERFRVFPATFADSYARLSRGVQIVTPKDLGLVIAETGIGNDSLVLDIGFGSGAVTAFLSRIVKHVYAYDVVQKNIDHGLRNLELLQIPKRYTVKKGDAYDAGSIEVPAVDVFFLDVPEPWRALDTARKSLKAGGWLVAYTPCITQANQFVDSLTEDWHVIKVTELIEREWKASGKAVRPVTKDFSHTAFLTFVRKVA